MLKKIILFCFLLLSIQRIVYADVTIIIKKTLMGQSITNIIYSKNSKILIMGGKDGKAPEFLIDLAQQKRYTLLTSKKMYVDNEYLSTLKEMDAQLSSKITIKDTGNNTLINNFPCKEYLFTTASNVSGKIFSTTKINLDSAAPDNWYEIKSYLSVILEHGALSVDGLPIRIEYSAYSQSNIMEVQSISYAELPDSLFYIGDYQVKN